LTDFRKHAAECTCYYVRREWLCILFEEENKTGLNKYLGNFILEFRGKVVFKRYDDRIGRCNEGIFFDGYQAFDERNWGGQCPVY
jgi:hypothetical protein